MKTASENSTASSCLSTAGRTELLTLAVLLKPEQPFPDSIYSLLSRFQLYLGFLCPVTQLTVLREAHNVTFALDLWLPVCRGEKRKKKKHNHTLNSHGIVFTSALSYSSFTRGEKVRLHPRVMTAGHLSGLDIAQRRLWVSSAWWWARQQADVGVWHLSQRNYPVVCSSSQDKS